MMTELPPELHHICQAADIPDGTAKRFEVLDRCLALFNAGGHLYATDDRCTHAGASLAEGFIEGETIECPLHGGRFHLPTGQPLSPPVKVAVYTYPVRVIESEVYVEIAGSGEGESGA